VDFDLFGFLLVPDNCGSPPRRHVIDDDAGRPFDIGRRLALGGEKRAEALVKIGAASVEADGHGGFLA
jgi:hypothetical protein